MQYTPLTNPAVKAEPLPIIPIFVASVAAVAVVAVCILVYFKKRKHKRL
jgi:hypothetical protein